jgi:hypothetical protein
VRARKKQRFDRPRVPLPEAKTCCGRRVRPRTEGISLPMWDGQDFERNDTPIASCSNALGVRSPERRRHPNECPAGSSVATGHRGPSVRAGRARGRRDNASAGLGFCGQKRKIRCRLRMHKAGRNFEPDVKP